MMQGFNHFAEIAELLEKGLKQGVESVAVKAKDNIKDQIVANGQVKTGEMLNSVQVVEGEGGAYEVQVGVPYAGYQNYGTRFLPPRPFFEPGILKAGAEMEEILLKNLPEEVAG
jgi:HK97 gp10 family phage protein